MQVSMSKCSMGYAELKALGHKVSGLTLMADDAKVAAVMLKPMPTTKKEVHSFLGFASYYRKFIKNFATIAAPLYEV